MTKIRKVTDKVFGGLKMTWPRVIIFAVAAALLTAVFLLVPIFENTSFYEMGVSFEAWVLFAVIIMVNCEKPLESAMKTFVFFLISQPLIYLFQVPFYDGGFGIFMYYRYWFYWTLLTFPMAFAGWYLKKHNWLSLLVLTPANLLLCYLGVGYVRMMGSGFPNHLLALLFCYGQILLYLYVFFHGVWKRLVGFAAVAAGVVATMLMNSVVDINLSATLPDEPSFSSSAVISLEDSSCGEASFINAEEGFVNIHLTKSEDTVLIIEDKGKTYRYDVAFEDENGSDRIVIEEQKNNKQS